MSNLETICKTLTNGLYGSFENTLLFLLKRHIKISILSVEHHIEYSNFWDEIRMKIGNFIIAYRIKYPDRFKTVIDFQYMKTEHAAKEHADRMNNIYDTIYDKRNYKRCSESISATCTAVEWLQHWSDALFKKVHLNKYADSEPGYSITGALIRMRESFKRVEEAINSMPSDEDVEKAVKEHKKI